MSVIEELKKLDEQRAKLLSGAKDEALQKAREAIKDLSDLGYNYSLVLAGTDTGNPGGRRTGVRAEVIATLKANPGGMARADILTAMGAAGDKRAEQSISNALSNAKKQGQVALVDGLYKIT